ncbi:MAG: ANTAR domain-containing protein [Mycobacteriales bacterium]
MPRLVLADVALALGPGAAAPAYPRPVVGQACGLLMARRSLSTDDAFTELVRLSQTSNTKLRDVAAALVADAQPDRSGARRP